MTGDLVEFLRARLAEDEQVAMASVRQSTVNLAGADAALVGAWHVVDRPATGTFVVTQDQWDRVAEVVPTYGGAHSDHIARHDPARVLAEVDAKRRIIDSLLVEPHAVLTPGGSTEIYCSADNDADQPCECGRDERIDRYLRLLALPYRGHPDDRDEWAPEA